MSAIQFILMTPITLAVCWLIMPGAERFGRNAVYARGLGVATAILWCVLPLERWFSDDQYTFFLVAMTLFQAAFLATAVLALFARPPWPAWAVVLVRAIGLALALLWGFNLLFMIGVLLSL